MSSPNDTRHLTAIVNVLAFYGIPAKVIVEGVRVGTSNFDIESRPSLLQWRDWFRVSDKPIPPIEELTRVSLLVGGGIL